MKVQIGFDDRYFRYLEKKFGNDDNKKRKERFRNKEGVPHKLDIVYYTMEFIL